jgi:hypothetical protein
VRTFGNNDRCAFFAFAQKIFAYHQRADEFTVRTRSRLNRHARQIEQAPQHLFGFENNAQHRLAVFNRQRRVHVLQ